MGLFAFVCLGIVTGLGSSILLLRFDSAWLKAISLTGGASILVAEFVGFSSVININDGDKSAAMVCLLISWAVTFCISLPILLKSFKRQSTKYRIQTWEILLGDKKAIEIYYQSKKAEIEREIEEKYKLDELRSERELIEKEKKEINHEKSYLEKIKADAEKILDKKHCIDIPIDHKFPLTEDFFELLPRYIKSISLFNHHISQLTESFINDSTKRNKSARETLEAYLHGLGMYVGQYLFEWRDVRVHFRKLNFQTKTYDKYIAVYNSGEEYSESLTPIPAEGSLIGYAASVKRSLVYSANKKISYKTTNQHIWKDYISMVFDRLLIEGQPILSLGVSVKHPLDHKAMLYFLSYIQIEQTIQDNLLKLEKGISFLHSSFQEAA